MTKKGITNWLMNKPYTKAMYLTALFTIILALSTVYFSYLENNRAEKEFELQMRPYIIIESIIPSHDTASSTSDYIIKLTNIGIIPADIESITYEYKRDNNLIKRSPHIYENGIILGKDRSTEVGINDLSSSDTLNVTIIIVYRAAIDDFKSRMYETSGTFEHFYGRTELKILANYMK